MNKRLFAFVLAIITVMVISGCKAKEAEVVMDSTETTVPAVETVEETIPGVVNMEEAQEDPRLATESNAGTQDTASTDPAEETDATVSTEEENPEETAPTIAPDAPTISVSDIPVEGDDGELSEFERYHAMSGAEQEEFMNSFASIEEFFAWYNNAKAEYEAAHPGIVIDSDTVVIGAADN